MTTSSLAQRAMAELLGSAVLAGVVVASGIAGDTLAPHLPAVALLCNSLATAGALFVLISIFGPISGAHFNPIVTASSVGAKAILRGATWVIFLVQIVGCCCGVVIANVTFSQPVMTFSTHHRSTAAHLVSEIIATAGLLFVITALVRLGRNGSLPVAVATYIGVAYFACSSTSFANPAITIGRMLTDTFAGIAPSSVVPFIGAQCLGGVLGVLLATYLIDDLRHRTGEPS